MGMGHKGRTIDEDALPVMVPRSDKPLVATPADRVARLRDHLARVVDATPGEGEAAPLRAEPDGFAARVVAVACTLCRGWCCRNGADDGFLDAATIARARHLHPTSGLSATVQLYLDRVPPKVHDESCIFHGPQGCTLDRSMRSDVCNAYYCGGLHAYLDGEDRMAPTVVIAGEGRSMQTSKVLRPPKP